MSLAKDPLTEYREEFLSYLKEMFDFKQVDNPGEIMGTLSSMSARARWIRTLVVRSTKPEYVRFRIDELDPFIAETEIQFKIWSRIAAVAKEEFDMTRG